MRAKYGCRDNVIPKVCLKNSNSNAWNDIVKFWDNFINNLVWRIGNGTTISFWEGPWVLKIPNLMNVALINLSQEMLQETMSTYAIGYGSWK
ncbi:hypothetical protein AHAS_Ahas20G0024300 [Arachis hypogaea]